MHAKSKNGRVVVLLAGGYQTPVSSLLSLQATPQTPQSPRLPLPLPPKAPPSPPASRCWHCWGGRQAGSGELGKQKNSSLAPPPPRKNPLPPSLTPSVFQPHHPLYPPPSPKFLGPTPPRFGPSQELALRLKDSEDEHVAGAPGGDARGRVGGKDFRPKDHGRGGSKGICGFYSGKCVFWWLFLIFLSVCGLVVCVGVCVCVCGCVFFLGGSAFRGFTGKPRGPPLLCSWGWYPNKNRTSRHLSAIKTNVRHVATWTKPWVSSPLNTQVPQSLNHGAFLGSLPV